jgi:hypothetical protein
MNERKRRKMGQWSLTLGCCRGGENDDDDVIYYYYPWSVGLVSLAHTINGTWKHATYVHTVSLSLFPYFLSPLSSPGSSLMFMKAWSESCSTNTLSLSLHVVCVDLWIQLAL